MTEDRLNEAEDLMREYTALKAKEAELSNKLSDSSTYSPLTLEICSLRRKAQECLEKAVDYIPELLAEINRLNQPKEACRWKKW